MKIGAVLSNPPLQPRLQYPCPSCIYSLFPSSSFPWSFTESAGMEERLQHQALHTEVFVPTSEPSSIRAPVKFFIGTTQLLQSSPPNISRALPFFSTLFFSSAIAKTVVSVLMYPSEKKDQEAIKSSGHNLAVQTPDCLSDKSWGRMSSGKRSVSLLQYFIFRTRRNKLCKIFNMYVSILKVIFKRICLIGPKTAM